MSAFATSTPALKPELFGGAMTAERSTTMTIAGTANRAMILTGLCAATAVVGYGWMESNPGVAGLSALGGALLGIVLSLVMMFKPAASPIAAPLYALCEGVFVGAVSYIYANSATKAGNVTGPMIILQASVLTFGTLFGMLMMYRAGWLRATGRFKKIMAVAGIGVLLFCISSWLLPLAGVKMGWAWDGGPIAIAINVAILLYASFSLIIDFDFVERGEASGAPRYMEWYGGFALLVTIVWIYLQFLRLLSMLNRRD